MHIYKLEDVGTLEKVVMHKMGSIHYNDILVVNIL
jgi:hypothetical protein